MIQRNILFLILIFSAFSVIRLNAQQEVKPFEHISVSVNAGTLGVGLQVASPVNHFLSLRTGLMMFTYTYDYEYDGFIKYEGFEGDYPIPMKAKANMVNGLLLADFFPFNKGTFHLTGGFYVGTPNIVDISGKADRLVEIGDIIVKPLDGKIVTKLETNAFKPYIGFGFGNSVTKNSRIGFKFELGAMFHGTPKFVVTEGQEITDLDHLEISEELDKFNRFLKNFNVYPVMNFQLNFRML